MIYGFTIAEFSYYTGQSYCFRLLSATVHLALRSGEQFAAQNRHHVLATNHQILHVGDYPQLGLSSTSDERLRSKFAHASPGRPVANVPAQLTLRLAPRGGAGTQDTRLWAARSGMLLWRFRQVYVSCQIAATGCKKLCGIASSSGDILAHCARSKVTAATHERSQAQQIS